MAESTILIVKNPASTIVLETPKVDVTLNTKNLPLRWILQVASFKSKETAQKLVTRLSEGNERAYFELVEIQQGIFHRVYVGPFSDKSLAIERQIEIDKTHKVQSQLLRLKPSSGN